MPAVRRARGEVSGDQAGPGPQDPAAGTGGKRRLRLVKTPAGLAILIATVLGLCAARQGIAIVPAELSRFDMPDIHFAPLVDDDAGTDIYLVCREIEGDPVVAGLCRIAEAAAAHGQAAGARAAGAAESRRQWPRIASS